MQCKAQVIQEFLAKYNCINPNHILKKAFYHFRKYSNNDGRWMIDCSGWHNLQCYRWRLRSSKAIDEHIIKKISRQKCPNCALLRQKLCFLFVWEKMSWLLCRLWFSCIDSNFVSINSHCVPWISNPLY